MPFWSARQARKRQAGTKTTEPIAGIPSDRSEAYNAPTVDEAIIILCAAGTRYTDYHIALGTDGWEHATIYHHMIRQAQQARWTMIMPDLTTTVDGEHIPLMMSQPITTCPLSVHPAPVSRQWGYVAMAVAAHQCGSDWIKEHGQ